MATALITGATSGIGRAVAEALASAGYDVLALGRNAQALTELGRSPRITPIAAEMTDQACLAAAIAGREIDVLVNNAGIVPAVAAFDEMSEDEILSAIAVNLTSALLLARMVLPGMKARRRGHVFFTGSTAGRSPVARYAVYGATKAGLGAFADALRLEVAPFGVRITEIVAGRTETNLYQALLSEDDRAAMYRNGAAVQPQDIAQMILTVLALPETTSVSRFDIVPTRPSNATATATQASKKEG